MTKPSQLPIAASVTARMRLALAAGVGVIAAVLFVMFGAANYAVLVGWDAAALVYVVLVLAVVLRFDAETTRTHALREDPGRAVADVLLLITSIASLGAVAVLIFHANHATGTARPVDIALGLLSVVISWAVVHTLFMLQYARLYYDDPKGGIDFNTNEPGYSDFAYLAFTIGMCFQVSDTAVSSRAIRSTVLRHALLAYVFGTVVVATTINAVVTLSSS